MNVDIINKVIKELKLSLPHRITWLLVTFLIASSESILYWLSPISQTTADKSAMVLKVVIILLFWLIVGLIASLVILRKHTKRQYSQDKFKDYKHSPQAGSWINKNYAGDRICAKCKVHDLFSPLNLDPEKGLFVCPNCGNESVNFPCIIHLNNGATVTVKHN